MGCGGGRRGNGVSVVGVGKGDGLRRTSGGGGC